ncbi:hypothetical protein KI387_000167 [Taxus chinensis]|uniref:Fatty acid desaturase domain-containing protein n=1 Tax=Taxus chinensis TaxID=29808 RepID=A0AA38GRI6_TAXCH|nr:hypothetical protein KI387_000167 [Taxus chinensis]
MAALALTSVPARAGGNGFHNILEAKGLKIRHVNVNASRFCCRIPHELQLNCQRQPVRDKASYSYPWRRTHTNTKGNTTVVFASAGDQDRIQLSDVAVKKTRLLSFVLDRKWSSADIATAMVVFGMHALCLLAPFTFTWKAFGVFVMLYVATGLLGITLSYHRNLSHRSFNLPKWLEYIFAYCGAQAMQGDPLDWVSTHRYHHQFCDSVKDPHSPNEGFWFSHMSWMFDENSMLARIGARNNVSDLEKQPFYRILRSTYIIHPIAMGLFLYALGGLPFVVWGMAVRVVWVYHITWLVNSACHVWGYQSWNTGDLSRNNWWVAALAFGEGWHNNHHAFEFSARHGLEWWQLDITWYIIRILEAVGLAKDVRLPSEQHKARMSF